MMTGRLPNENFYYMRVSVLVPVMTRIKNNDRHSFILQYQQSSFPSRLYSRCPSKTLLKGLSEKQASQKYSRFILVNRNHAFKEILFSNTIFLMWLKVNLYKQGIDWLEILSLYITTLNCMVTI